jgi:hypothetical protein
LLPEPEAGLSTETGASWIPIAVTHATTVFYHYIRCDRAQDSDRANLAYTGSDKIFAEIGGTNDYSAVLINIHSNPSAGSYYRQDPSAGWE